MSMDPITLEQYARAESDLGAEHMEHWLAITGGVVVWVRVDHSYAVFQEGRGVWWTNDFPLVVPEVLSSAGAAIRAEHLSRCKGPGKCYSWCKAKRSSRGKRVQVVVEEQDA